MPDRTAHPQRFRVIGYKTGPDAPIKKLPAAYLVDHLPTAEQLRAITGSASAYLRPVYNILGDGHEHLRCPICFPRAGEMIDQRVAPGA